MTIRVGVLGTGSIGTDHARRLAFGVQGATVTRVFDVATERAERVASEIGAKTASSPKELISSDDVDAIVIATPGDLHAELTISCIKAGKPVLCEKPLAPSAKEALDVLLAESEYGKRLVQVGFMRRYDSGYLEIKRAMDSGIIGEPVALHCIHRNPSPSTTGFSDEMIITDSAVHEIDVIRWLADEEIVAARAIIGKRSPLAPGQLRDPQFLIFETTSGIIADVEVFVSCQYGYDVRCEAVGSTGTATLETPLLWTLRSGFKTTQPIPGHWQDRFGEAYLRELQDWIGRIARDETPAGPSSWDGYAASAVAEAAVLSLRTGERQPVHLVDRPSMFA
jgi:myo-inositol 2-dehydrogenase/D-chiro-inositol 1-dehydrogenase